jgi:hypothetical protein
MCKHIQSWQHLKFWAIRIFTILNQNPWFNLSSILIIRLGYHIYQNTIFAWDKMWTANQKGSECTFRAFFDALLALKKK